MLRCPDRSESLFELMIPSSGARLACESHPCRGSMTAHAQTSGTASGANSTTIRVASTVAYLRSLLSKSILPHKILQCFVFDVCMWFRQEMTCVLGFSMQFPCLPSIFVFHLMFLFQSGDWVVEIFFVGPLDSKIINC